MSNLVFIINYRTDNEKNYKSLDWFALYTIKPRSNKAILPRVPYTCAYPERPWIKLLIFGIRVVIGWKWLIEIMGPFRRHIFLEEQHRKFWRKSSIFMFFHRLRYRRENTWASKFHRGRKPVIAETFNEDENVTAYTWLCVNLLRVFLLILIL